MERKGVCMCVSLFYGVLYLFHACIAEGNNVNVQNQVGGDEHAKAYQNEREKYFKGKGGQFSCAKDVDRCKLAMQQNDCIWGYEDGCKSGQRYIEPLCREAQGYRQFGSLKERVDAFWSENDFGYVKNVKKLDLICEPKDEDDSSFACNEQLTFCRGKNIFMDFTFNGRSVYERSESHPFKPGEFGGHCKLVPDKWKGNNVFRGKLRSWAANDIDQFASLPFKPSDPKNCDVVVHTPTILVDLDFTGNLYHHFCDFLNLYLTLHANNSLYSTFDVAKWDVLERLGTFGDTWKAFTKNVYSMWLRYNYKKVCFKDVVFGLLPRMAYGLYYSTPLVEGCSRSGIFKAFSEYILNGLKIKQNRKAKSDLLRVTLLYRSTKFRRIVNRDELINVMNSIPGITVKSVDFNRDMPFLEQLAISANSDIFIGIHGAGLAHTLFLPDWAVLFELFVSSSMAFSSFAFLTLTYKQ